MFGLINFHPSHSTTRIVFHHDGPFDACAPSRNRNTTKAPIRAWTSINAEDEEVAARYRDKEDGMNPVAPALSYDPSYPSEVPRSPPAGANYNSYYSEPPKKKVDVIAEAWGMHEPEPYEEFFAGGGDPDGPITNGSSMKEARANGSGRRTREDLASRPRGSNHIPPPQPIFIADGSGPETYSAQPSPGVGGANLGRNKSLMQRIRRMRDSPNVPFGFDETPVDGASHPTSIEGGSHGFPAHRRDDIRSFRSWWPWGHLSDRPSPSLRLC
jgi:Pal1 cell morphology protein